MPVHDNELNQTDEVTLAAHAAASWVRARRTQWTTPPDVTEAAPAPAARGFESPAFDPPMFDAPVFDPVFDPVVPTPQIALTTPTDAPAWPLAIRIRRRLTLDATTRRWLARGAIAGGLFAVAVVAAPPLWRAVPAWPASSPPVEVKRAAPIARTRAGRLRVVSTPPGASVLVDGKPRGVTPLDLADVTPGRHDVALQSDAGGVTRTVTVAANATVTIDEAIFSGFVTVYAPFEVTISEGGRVLRADDHQQILLAPGAHELRVTNRALGYETVQRIVVKPGEATNVQLTPGPSTLTVTASEAAEVWLDGARLGETPLNAAPVALGLHELVVKKAAGGERRFSVTIGAKPFTIAVDF